MIGFSIIFTIVVRMHSTLYYAQLFMNYGLAVITYYSQ